MKHFCNIFLSLLIFTACSGSHIESDEHDHESEAIEHSHGNTDDGEISIAPDRAAELGIATTVVQSSPIYNIIEVTGEVITDASASGAIVAPASGEVSLSKSLALGQSLTKGQKIGSISMSKIAGGDPIEAARISLEAAKREVDRLKPLRDEGIVTVAEYNAALENYELAKNAASTAGRNVVSPTSGVVASIDVANGQYVEAGTIIATLASEGNMLVRADIPKKYSEMLPLVKSAIIIDPHNGEAHNGTLAAAPSAALASAGYLPIYFNIEDKADMAPGCFVDIYLSSGESRQGIAVPIQAVSERMGRKFVYIRLDEDCYERRPVEVGQVNGNTIEITSGIQPGEQLVTEGVTFVRLAENQNAPIPGHTHNH